MIKINYANGFVENGYLGERIPIINGKIKSKYLKNVVNIEDANKSLPKYQCLNGNLSF